MVVRSIQILVQLDDQTLEERRELSLHLVSITQLGSRRLEERYEVTDRPIYLYL